MRIIVLASVLAVLGSFACGPSASEDKAADDTSGDDDTTGGDDDTTGGDDDDVSGGAGALPATTFLFVRKVADSVDNLIAVDTVTEEVRVVTDLRGDGSEGWGIDGFAISSDRKRIALS